MNLPLDTSSPSSVAADCEQAERRAERCAMHGPATLYRPSSRYVDQPTSLGARLCGIGGVALVALLLLAALLVRFEDRRMRPDTHVLTVFDVAPPAAPPEPERETPPEPRHVARERPVPAPRQPLVNTPDIRLPDVPLSNLQPNQAPDPSPPIERTIAPEATPLPPAPRSNNARPTWEGAVLAALNKAKRYPREALFARQQGVPWIRFVIDRNGKVLSSRLERSSGHDALDREAVALPKRAQPLPRPPAQVAGDTIELVLPVEFLLPVRP